MTMTTSTEVKAVIVIVIGHSQQDPKSKTIQFNFEQLFIKQKNINIKPTTWKKKRDSLKNFHP